MSLECTAVVFYGIEAGARAVAGFYDVVVGWSEKVGHPPTRISKGRQGKISGFSGTGAKLKSTGFEGITALSLYSTDSDKAIPTADFLVSSCYEASASYAYLVARSSLATLSPTSMFPLAQSLIRELKPKYGIGYTRPQSRGPSFYAVGICMGLGPRGDGVGLSESERQEALRISRWGDAMAARVWEKGLLRDIYPWNFLTRSQLSRSVNGLPLEQWIGQAPDRGTLRELAEGVSMWEVPVPGISAIRAALQSADVIFDWKRHLS